LAAGSGLLACASLYQNVANHRSSATVPTKSAILNILKGRETLPLRFIHPNGAEGDRAEQLLPQHTQIVLKSTNNAVCAIVPHAYTTLQTWIRPIILPRFHTPRDPPHPLPELELTHCSKAAATLLAKWLQESEEKTMIACACSTCSADRGLLWAYSHARKVKQMPRSPLSFLYEHFTLQSFYTEYPADATAIVDYQMKKVSGQSMDAFHNNLDLMAFPEVFSTGRNGTQDSLWDVKIGTSEFNRSRLLHKDTKVPLSMSYLFHCFQTQEVSNMCQCRPHVANSERQNLNCQRLPCSTCVSRWGGPVEDVFFAGQSTWLQGALLQAWDGHETDGQNSRTSNNLHHMLNGQMVLVHLTKPHHIQSINKDMYRILTAWHPHRTVPCWSETSCWFTAFTPQHDLLSELDWR